MRVDEAPVVEVITAVEGWCALETRSPTLDGSLPLRVVQGCLPMLDGTALGLQIVLQIPLRVRRRWGRWRVEPLPAAHRVERWGMDPRDPEGDARYARAETRRRAAVPALLAQGVLDAEGSDRAASLARIVRSRTTSSLRLFTGLVARVAPTARLLALRASPRGTLGADLGDPAVIPAHGRWAPVTLDLALDPSADEVIVQGEVGALLVVPSSVPTRVVSLSEAPEAARALLDFYDARYFAAKRDGEVTRKYRRLVADAPAPVEAGAITVVEGGPTEIDATGHDAPTSLTLRCGLSLSARFDGQRVWVDVDPAELSARRDAIERAWAPFARPDDPARQGALWYLTKYMTPHPAGEPHFFVKPCALVVTPPGWSTLVEGRRIAGVGETLRGLVHTDQFHAVPAVFGLAPSAHAGAVPRGTPLARLLPLPRAWCRPTVRAVPFAPR